MEIIDHHVRTPEEISIYACDPDRYRSLWSPMLPSFQLRQWFEHLLHERSLVDLFVQKSGNSRSEDFQGPSDVHLYQTTGDRPNIPIAGRSIQREESDLLKVSLWKTKSKAQIYSTLEPLMIDASPGDTHDAVEILVTGSPPAKFRTLFMVFGFFVSNNHDREEGFHEFLDWILENQREMIISTFLDYLVISYKSHAIMRIFIAHLLHNAIKCEEMSLIQSMLSKGADADITIPGQVKNLLDAAVDSGNTAMVGVLLDHGAKFSTDYDLGDFIHEAWEYCEPSSSLDIITMMLEHGVDFDPTTIIWQIMSIFHYSNLGNGDEQSLIAVLQTVLDNGAVLGWCKTYPKSYMLTPLQCAAQLGFCHLLQFLLGAGVGANDFFGDKDMVLEHLDQLVPACECEDGYCDPGCGTSYSADFLSSPLTIAVGMGTKDMVKLLLAADADPSFSFIDAVHAGDKDILQKIICHGLLNLDSLDDLGNRMILYPLQGAAAAGDIDIALDLLEAGANINPPYGTSPLLLAVEKGDIAMVKLLLINGAHVNKISERIYKRTQRAWSYSTPLAVAAALGDLEIVEMLINAGAILEFVNINACGARTAIQAAAEKGNTQMMRYLIDRGANIHAPAAPTAGITVLQGAVSSGDYETILFALEQSGDIYAPSSERYGTSVLGVVIESQNLGLLTVFLERGIDVNMRWNDEDGCWVTPLLLATRLNAHEIISVLLRAGAHINSTGDGSTEWERTPLGVAILNNDISTVQLLLHHGAHLSVLKDRFAISKVQKILRYEKKEEVLEFLLRNGAFSDSHLPGMCPPLQTALFKGDLRFATSLIGHGAKLDYDEDSLHASPLQVALAARAFEEAETLIKLRCNVNAAHSKCYDCLRWSDWSVEQVTIGLVTPLQLAVNHQRSDIVELLLFNGADVNAPASTSRWGRTALQAAVEKGHIQLTRLLLSKGADTNAPAGRDHGVTALQAAAVKGYLRIAQTLLLHGADITAPRSLIGGRTAIEGAAEQGRLDMVKYLLDNYPAEEDIQIEFERAIRRAKEENQWHVLELLRNYNRPPTSSDKGKGKQKAS